MHLGAKTGPWEGLSGPLNRASYTAAAAGWLDPSLRRRRTTKLLFVDANITDGRAATVRLHGPPLRLYCSQSSTRLYSLLPSSYPRPTTPTSDLTDDVETRRTTCGSFGFGPPPSRLHLFISKRRTRGFLLILIILIREPEPELRVLHRLPLRETSGSPLSLSANLASPRSCKGEKYSAPLSISFSEVRCTDIYRGSIRLHVPSTIGRNSE